MAKTEEHLLREEERPAIEKVVTPLVEFGEKESSAGITLTLAALVGLFLANSPWQAAYFEVLEAPLILSFAGTEVELTLHHLVNEFLMAFFFLLAGLELKREIMLGSLSTWKKALLPTVSALFGMLVPVALFFAFNYGQPGVGGWAVPMATDIAFALGVLLLLGNRAGDELLVFLVALAVVDDLGAILVIAVFYSGGLNHQALAWTLGLVFFALLLNRAGVRYTWPYVLVGLLLWFAVYRSGIHATLAGVLLALVVPGWARLGVGDFKERARERLDELSEGASFLLNTRESNVVHLHRLEVECERVQPLSHQLEYRLHPWVYYGILPVFALVNSGVNLEDIPQGFYRDPLFLGIVVGLVLGKPLGVWLAGKICGSLGWSRLPGQVSERDLGGVGALAGIGFTMALFIAGLAFPEAPRLEALARVGILIGSATSALTGWSWLRLSLESEPEQDEE